MERTRRKGAGPAGAFPAGAFALALLAMGCGGGEAPETVSVRLGYFANVTHAPAIVALERGLFAEALGPGASLEARVFNAGPEAVEAIFSDALDVSYIGPNPALNAFVQSGGQAIRIVAGATSGGAALVVHPSIRSPAELAGRRLATPQLGNTQDVALRSWLARQGLSTNLEGGGDVSVVPQANAQTLETFRLGEIQGAWVPEPWATRLVLEGGGSVLVDERSLWPDGRFVTTHVIVRTRFLSDHPELVERLLRAHVQAVELANAQPGQARALVNAALARLSGKPLPDAVLERAWESLHFTVDPLAASLRRSAEDAVAAGLLERAELAGIYELGPLNEVLRAAGQPPVAP